MKPFGSLLIRRFDEIPSTSLYLSEIIRQGGSPPDLVIARSQTDGQGRRGRRFYSPSGTGVYFTFCFRAEGLPQHDLTPRTALAVREGIHSLYGIDCGLKWVNDLYLDGRKVCGILCQRVGEFVLAGIGVNLNRPEEIPSELAGTFGYLSEAPLCGDGLPEAVYDAFCRVVSLPEDDVLLAYRSACFHIGRLVSVLFDGKEIRGRCLGIGDDFCLILSCEEGVRSFSSG
ncbi:MAG: biotin--[Clostridia bacterium]|nr:biotin--[acetyl-CoA-carboxylase] ligase [Clostridia bacterium]